jgi:hypothetical protein
MGLSKWTRQLTAVDQDLLDMLILRLRGVKEICQIDASGIDLTPHQQEQLNELTNKLITSDLEHRGPRIGW